MSHNVQTPFTSGYSYGWSLGKILALQLILFTKITRKCEMPKIILKKNLLKTPNKSIRNGSGNGGYPAGCCHGEPVLLVAASAPQDFWMDTRCVQRLINVCGSMIRGNHEAGRHIHLRCS